MSATVTGMSTTRARRNWREAVARQERAHETSQKRTHPSPAKPPITVRFRGPRILRTDTHVRYGGEVAKRSVDREAWANVVAHLINQETSGNKSRFASLVGVTYKTVLRWINQQTDVSEESVVQVARAVGVKPMELLVRVGFYDPADLTAAEQPPTVDNDPALDAILEADVPPRVKARMIQRLQQLRAQEHQRQVDEVRWWIDQARGA